MSMSTHVIGFRPPDQRFREMRSIWEACKSAKIEPPREVSQFFGDTDPDPSGIEVDIGKAVYEYRDDMREGYEIDLTKLPAEVKYIRFFNAY